MNDIFCLFMDAKSGVLYFILYDETLSYSMEKDMVRKCLMVLVAIFMTTQTCWAGSYKLATIEYPPFVFLENGKAAGMNVEVIGEAFARAGHSVSYDFVPWTRGLKSVEKGRVDGLFPVYKTPERMKYAIYTSEVLGEEAATFFVPSASPIQFDGDLAKLSGYTFGIIRDFSYGQMFDDAKNSGVLRKFEVTDSLDSNVKMLVSSRYDIFVGEPFTALDTMKKMGVAEKVRRLSPDIQSTSTYVMFSRAKNLEKLADDISKALKSMKDDGTYQAIIDKYSK